MKDPRNHFREQAQSRDLNVGFYNTSKESAMRQFTKYDTATRPSYDVGRTPNITVQPPSPERPSAVHDAYARLAQAVGTLSSEIDGLSSRLVPVLGTDDFLSDAAEPSAGYGVPLADSIASEAARVEDLIAHVRKLGARLAL